MNAIRICVVIASMMLSTGTHANEKSLQGGEIELGLGGSLTHEAGVTQSRLELRGGRMVDTSLFLANVEIRAAYGSSLDAERFDAELALGVLRQLDEGHWYASIGAAVGVRQEWIGSFQQGRVPVGVDLGLRALVGGSTMIRFEYRYRRVLSDAVASFNQHEMLMGLSVRLRREP